MKSLLVAFVAALTIVVLGVSRLALAAGTPAELCAASKLDASGMKAGREVKCWSKEVHKPGTYSACAAKAQLKFARAFAKAEVKGGCVSTGDAAALETTVDTFVENVIGELTGSPAGALLGTTAAKECASAKLKATGKASSGSLRCDAKAVVSGSLDVACISKIEARYGHLWDAAEARGGCALTRDKSTITAEVDGFVNDMGR